MVSRLCMMAGLALIGGGCAHSAASDFPLAGRDYVLTAEPNQVARRFDLRLVSKTDRSLCISQDNWSNAPGWLAWSSERVFVENGGRRFPITDQNFGSCADCGSWVIKPGATLAGKVAYDQFDPEATSSGAPRLSYNPPVRACAIGETRTVATGDPY